MMALRWDDIDFTTGKLHVRRAKGGMAGVHPLGGKELRALRRLQRETPEGSRTVHVFVSERLAPLSVAGTLATGGGASPVSCAQPADGYSATPSASALA